MSKNLQYKQYMRKFMFAMLLYSISIFIYVFAVVQLQNNNLLYLTFLIPIIPTLLALYFWLKAFAVQDELDKRISAESWAIATLIVGFISFTYGFLEQAGLPPFRAMFFFPTLLASWGIVNIFVRRRYQ